MSLIILINSLIIGVAWKWRKIIAAIVIAMLQYFFLIIRAVMGETKNFLWDQLRINIDINDAKFEEC